LFNKRSAYIASNLSRKKSSESNDERQSKLLAIIPNPSDGDNSTIKLQCVADDLHVAALLKFESHYLKYKRIGVICRKNNVLVINNV